MTHGIFAALSGARAQEIRLDVAAQNLANTSTPGYRGTRPVFQEMLARAPAAAGAGRAAPPPRADLHFVHAAGTALDTSQGALNATGAASDLALEGDGWLRVQTAGGERLARGGSFVVDADGSMRLQSGAVLLGESGQPLRAAPNGPTPSVQPDGTVRQGESDLGRLGIVSVENASALTPEGAGVYVLDPAAGATSPSSARVLSGYLEGSNVTPVEGMVTLVDVTRSFEASQRAIEAFARIDRRAATDLLAR